MPTYEYVCRDCGEHLEVVQSFKDDPLTVCPGCSGVLRKVFSAAGLIFKGSGWHVKDYATSTRREGTSSSSSASESASSSGDSSSGGSSSGDSSSGSSSGSSSSDGGSSTSSDTTAKKSA